MNKVFLNKRCWVVLVINWVSVMWCISTVHADPIDSTDITYSQSKSSETVAQKAARWKITEQEYHRYQTLIKGPISRWNPEMDPVLVLGLFAESESEQQRYAELYALQEHELTSRTLAFERAYHKAFARLFPDARVVDKRLLEPYYAAKQKKNTRSSLLSAPELRAGDRLLYFPRHSCQNCGQSITRLQHHASQVGVVLDIYIKEASTEDDVRQWAVANAIAIEWVNRGVVTLNRDRGLYQQLVEKTDSAALSRPVLFLVRGDKVFRVNERTLGL